MIGDLMMTMNLKVGEDSHMDRYLRLLHVETAEQSWRKFGALIAYNLHKYLILLFIPVA